MTNMENIEEVLKQALKVIEESKQKTMTKPKKKAKTIKEKVIKEQINTPKIPYKNVKDILNNMDINENISRFGILYNSDNPYSISAKAISKFYQDYNISVFKIWYMNYKDKDIIINKQLEKNSKFRNKNIKARIKVLEESLQKEHPNKTPEQIAKMEMSLNERLNILKGELNG